MYFTELQPNLKYLVCHVYYLYKIFGSKQRDLHSDDNIHFAQQYEPVLRCVPVVVPLIHTSLTASVYTTIAVAVERAATFTPSMDRVSYQNPWNIIKENRMYTTDHQIMEFSITDLTPPIWKKLWKILKIIIILLYWNKLYSFGIMDFALLTPPHMEFSIFFF